MVNNRIKYLNLKIFKKLQVVQARKKISIPTMKKLSKPQKN